jgi:hypothetical protein
MKAGELKGTNRVCAMTDVGRKRVMFAAALMVAIPKAPGISRRRRGFGQHAHR